MPSSQRTSSEDYQGNKIVEGDRIAATFRIGSTVELRTGTVTGFGTRDYCGTEAPTLTVHWDENQLSRTPASSITEIDDNRRRFVKVS